MDCDVSPLLQAAANSQGCPPQNSIISFDEESDTVQSLDDPPLEKCKRELDAVLAALDA